YIKIKSNKNINFHLLEHEYLREKKRYAATTLFSRCLKHGNKGRTIRAGIVAALTILLDYISNLDMKAVIVKTNTLLAFIDILQAQPLLSLYKRDTERLVSVDSVQLCPLMDLSNIGNRGRQKESYIFVRASS
ncbi:LOW QUALITY PROTEIN: hypothetical protein HID58_017509, partial [Brassica napus]